MNTYDSCNKSDFIVSTDGEVIFNPRTGKFERRIREVCNIMNGNEEKNIQKDNINPDHYKSNKGIEVIDVIEAFTESLSGVVATDTGNIIKYACRWKDKDGIQDLKKLKWYVEHLISTLEKESNHD